MSIWQLQEAKNKFSKLVEEAMTHGPQIVTKRGVESVVVISKNEYNALSKRERSLIDVLKSAPKIDWDLSRDNEPIRKIEL